MEEQKIKELVQRMKQGEQTAFEEVYRETYRSVYFICLGFMKNEENAKDAMQDTYMTAFSKLEQLKEEEKFIAWLKQIAVNRCKRLLEKNGPELVDAEDLENLKKEENENFLPEEYITNKAKRKIVMDIMRKKLSDIQYQTVILFYFNGLEVEEIAEMMECPPGTVKSRLSVARNKIKEGVLEYEKENKDKLYAFVGIPFLTSLLAAEASAMEVPDVWSELVRSLNEITKKEDVSILEKGENKVSDKMSNKVKAGTAGKSKLIIGIIATVVVIGAGIGIAVGVAGKGNEAGNGTLANQENTGVESPDIDVSESAENESADGAETTEDVQVHEVFSLQQRWLTSHDFSKGQLESAPADFVFFEDAEYPFSAPYSFDFVAGLPDMETDLSTVIPAREDDAIYSETIRRNDGRYYDGYNVIVYNLSNQELSIQDCINSGWVSFENTDPNKTDHFGMLLGYEEEEITSSFADGRVRNRDYLEQVLIDFGSPSYIGVGLTLDSAYETIGEMNDRLDNPSDYENNLTITMDTSLMAYYESAQTVDGDETLTFAWEYDEYVLILTILDGSSEWEEGIYSPSPIMMYSKIYNREVWDACLEIGGLNFSENKIDVFYPEGFVMPEKAE